MLTSQAATARRLARTLPALAVAVLAVTCRDNPVAPRGGGLAHLAVQPTFRSPVNLTAFGLTIDSLRVTIVRPVADTIKDTTVFFSPDSDAIHLPLTFELKEAAETLSVSLTLSAGGVPLFSGTQMVPVSVGSAGPAVPISLAFTGPGAGVTALHITPLDSVVHLGDTFRYRVTADSAGTPVTTFYASWSTSDTLVARINAFGILQAPLTRNAIWVIVRTFSGARDSTRVTFVPLPTVLAVASGAAQTGPVGSPLALPLRARVTAADGLGVKGIPVTFAPATGGGSVTTATVVTDTLGYAQTTATLGALVGTHTFQANAAGLTAVTFSESATAATPTQLLVSAGDAQTAIVAAAVAVAPAVLLKDAFNNPVPGVVVTYAIASGGGSVTKGVDTTNSLGIATIGGWTLGTIAGANTLSATAGALSHTFTATGLAGAASATVSTVSVDSGTLAAGHATLVHLQAKDAFGNNLTAGGLTVGFTVTGGSSTGSLSVVTDHLNGTYSAVFTGILSGTADTVHATIGGTAVTSTPPLLTVLPGAASLATSIVTVDSATLASGDSTLVHLQAKDAAGNNLTVGGLTVLFSTQGGGSTGAFSVVTDNANGTYRAYFKAIIAGTPTSIQASIGGNAVTSALPGLAVLPGAISLVTSTLTASSSTIASGALTLLTLQAKDAAGNNRTTGGDTVVFAATGGTSTGTFSGTTDHANGTYSATFTGVAPGTATTLGATIGGKSIGATVSIVVVLGNTITARSVVSVSSPTVPSGSVDTLRLQSKDSLGNNLSIGGLIVVFTRTGGLSAGTIGPTSDHGDGTYTAIFTGTTAGTATTIGATIGGSPVTSTLPTLTVLAGAASGTTSTVTTTIDSVVSGAGLVVTFHAKDAAGNPITSGGATVSFSVSGGTSTVTFGATTDNVNGTYDASLTGVLAGTSDTIHATVNGSPVTTVLPTVFVVPGAVALSRAAITVSDSVAIAAVADTLTLQAKDSAGNNLTHGGLAVVFAITGGTSTGLIAGTTDHANGKYSAIFTGIAAGTPAIIGATIGGSPVTSALPGIRVTATLHVSDITVGDSVWTAAASPHIVTRNIRILAQKTLTIEAGAVVKFDTGAGIQVGDSASSNIGALVLDGTNGTITLTANTPTPTPAFWRGIDVQRQLGGKPAWNKVLVEWAGASGACVTVSDNSGVPVDMENVRIRQCGALHHGILQLDGTLHFHGGEVDTAGVAGIGASNGTVEIDSSTFTGMNAGWNVATPLVHLGPSSANKFFGNGAAAQLNAAQLPGLLRQDTLAGNADNFLVFGGQPDSSAAVVTLYRQPRGASGIDYRFMSGSGLLDVGSVTGQELVLEANLAVGFDAGTGIVIGDSAGTRAGTIRSLGTDTASAPSLTSVPPLNSHGGWVGLEIGRLAAPDTLRFVKIKYAGDSLPGHTVFRAGVWVRNAALVPLLLDNVQVLSSGWSVSQATSGGIVVTGTGSGFDLHNSLVANNAGYQVAVGAPNVRVTGNNLAGGTIGLGGFISGGAQLTAADSLGPNTIDGNGYAVALTPGSLPAFYQTTLGLTNVTDTLLLEGGSLNADAQLPHFPNFVWRALGGINVGGNATLNLAAGNTVAFDSLAGVIVGDSQPGRLTANAPATAPVLLTSSAGLNGTWSGVAFFNLAGSGFSDTLRNVIFDRAGVLQCNGVGNLGVERQRMLRRAPKPPRAPALPRGVKGAPQRGVIVGGCGSQTPLGAIQFPNQSSASLWLDSVTVRGGPAYAIEVSSPAGGQVLVSHGQFYNNSYPATFFAQDGATLSVDSSDIYHYGRTYQDAVVVLFNNGNPMSAVDNWWGDVSGPGVDSLLAYYAYADSIGRAILNKTFYPVLYAPFRTSPYFPITGPAASVIATPSGTLPGTQAGFVLPDSIRARVLDSLGRGLPSASVIWNTRVGSGGISPVSATGDAGGRAGAIWTPSVLAQLDTGLAFTPGVAQPGEFFLDVQSGVAVSSNWQVIPDVRTEGVVSADSNTVSFTSTLRHGVIVTNAFDLFGNAPQPSFTFNDVPSDSLFHGYGSVDSTHADTVFFTVSSGFPTTYQLHGFYPTLNGGITDSILINVNPVGVAVQIWGFFGYAPTDSATFNSICPSTGPFNFYCQKTVYAYVVDSAGRPLQSNPGYFPTWQMLVPGDTTIRIDPSYLTTFSPPVNAQANGTSAIVVTVNSDGPPALAKPSDTLYIAVQQAIGKVAVSPDTLSVGLGDTVTLHAFVADSGGSAMPTQQPVGWTIIPPFDTHLTVIDSAADSIRVRLDSGVWTYNGFLTSFVGVVNAYAVATPTIVGQGTLFNPIHYEGSGVGGGPVHAVVDPVNHWVGVINQSGSGVTLTNTATNTKFGPVLTGLNPIWGAVDPALNRLYVANNGEGTVAVIGEPDTVVQFLNMGTSVFGMAVDPASHRAFVATRLCTGIAFCSTRSYVIPIDGTVDTVLMADTIPLGTDTTFAPQGMAWNKTTGRLYVGRSDGVLMVVDPSISAVIDSVVLAPGSAINDVAVNDSTNTVYATSTYGQHFFIIDGATLAVSEPFGTNTPGGVSVDVRHNRVYFGSIGNNTVTVVDGANPTSNPFVVVGTGGGDNPMDAAVDQVTGTVYAPHTFGLAILQFYGKQGPVPSGAPPIRTAGSKPTPRSITPRIPAALQPQGGTRRPPPARRPGITLPGLLPGAKGAKKSPN